MKSLFYIIYNYDIKELPYMLCDTVDEVAKALNYSKRMVQYGMKRNLVFTLPSGKRYTVKKWNYKDLERVE